MDKENKLILYKDDEGRVSVNTRFADEDVWLTQAQLVEIYQSSKSNISEHIKHIFEDKELDETVVVRKFRTTTQHGAIEGKTQSRDVAHGTFIYNLNMRLYVLIKELSEPVFLQQTHSNDSRRSLITCWNWYRGYCRTGHSSS